MGRIEQTGEKQAEERSGKGTQPHQRLSWEHYHVPGMVRDALHTCMTLSKTQKLSLSHSTWDGTRFREGKPLAQGHMGSNLNGALSEIVHAEKRWRWAPRADESV